MRKPQIRRLRQLANLGRRLDERRERRKRAVDAVLHTAVEEEVRALVRERLARELERLLRRPGWRRSPTPAGWVRAGCVHAEDGLALLEKIDDWVQALPSGGACRRRHDRERDRPERGDSARHQHDTHLWLFFAPSDSSSASASGQGWIRCTGPLAISAVVLPSRLTAFTSAPFETRYLIISTSPRAAAL